MAVPDGGSLSLRGIRDELGTNNYAGSNTYSYVSLYNMSLGENGTINTNNAVGNRPNGSAPHEMSEFYLYDHDAEAESELTSQTVIYVGTSFRSTPCGLKGSNVTWYHNGSSIAAASGDNVYSDEEEGEDIEDGGYLFLSVYYIVESSRIQSAGSCGRSERRLKYNIELIGESPMGIPIYHFNYKDTKYGKGRFVGTMVDDLERLGFTNTLLKTEDGSIFVNYSEIDVPFHNVTIWYSDSYDSDSEKHW